MMNRHIINAIIDHAEQGNQVAIISKRAKPIIEQIDSEVNVDAISRILRANGQERIEFTNGAQITFRRAPDWLRGRTANLVVAPMNLNEEELGHIIPAIATGGEIIGYM